MAAVELGCKGLHEQLGEIVLARVLSDGALLVKCGSEEQREKVLKLTKVCNRLVESTRKVGGGRGAFLRGVIYGIPVGDDLEEVRRSINGGKVRGIKRL